MDVLSYKLGKNAGGGGSTGGRDWTQLGYEEEPKSIDEGFEYAKSIKQDWDATATSMYRKFINNKQLIYFPNVDMTNITTAEEMFKNCVKLEYFDTIDLSSNCNMSNMFNIGNNTNTKLTGNKIYIKNNKNNNAIFNNIGILELNELVLQLSATRGTNMFTSISNLKIKKITDTLTSREVPMMTVCSMEDDTIKVFLEYFKTLTTQPSDKKTLKAMGFTGNNINQAVLLEEWQDLVEAGWTTGN